MANPDDDRVPGPGPAPPAPFAGTTSRGSVNYMIRNTQQQLVALSGQADLKASILITASSVVLTVGLTQARDSRFHWGFGVLARFVLVSLLAAILCVLPSFGSLRQEKRAAGPLNLLFFGDFSLLEEGEYVERLGALSRDDSEIYEAQARDLHRQGVYLIRHKYRYLRFGYLMFLLGFASAAVVTAGGLAI